jgi:hypothetical protein
MNSLTDKEILALHELCNAVVDGTLTEKQKAELSRWLLASKPARQYYVRTLGLSAGLFSYASEMQVEAPDVFAPRPQVNYFSLLLRWLAPLGAAAAIVVGFWLANSNPQKTETRSDESVAQITASKECQWADGKDLPPGARLHKGQEIELAHGFAEVTFDSGARAVLEGPATLEVDSAWVAKLKHGALKASVPHEAIGFSVSAATVHDDRGDERRDGFARVEGRGGGESAKRHEPADDFVAPGRGDALCPQRRFGGARQPGKIRALHAGRAARTVRAADGICSLVV